MGDKDAISQTKKKDSPTKSDSNVSASPIIILLALASIVGVVIILFKDKIFKKPQDLKDLNEKSVKEDPVETTQEKVEEPEATEIQDKFSHN